MCCSSLFVVARVLQRVAHAAAAAVDGDNEVAKMPTDEVEIKTQTRISHARREMRERGEEWGKNAEEKRRKMHSGRADDAAGKADGGRSVSPSYQPFQWNPGLTVMYFGFQHQGI